MAQLQGAVDAWARLAAQARATFAASGQLPSAAQAARIVSQLLAVGGALSDAASPFMHLAMVVEHGWADARIAADGRTLTQTPRSAVNTANILTRSVYELDRSLAAEYGDPADDDAGDNRAARAGARVTAVAAESAVGFASKTLGDAFRKYATQHLNDAAQVNALAAQELQGLYRMSLYDLVERHLKDQARAPGASRAMDADAWRAWIAQLAALKMPTGIEIQNTQRDMITDAYGAGQMVRVMAEYLTRQQEADRANGGGGGGGGSNPVGTQATLLGLLRELINQNAALRGAVVVAHEHATASDVVLAATISDLVITPPPPPPALGRGARRVSSGDFDGSVSGDGDDDDDDGDADDDEQQQQHADEIAEARKRHSLPNLVPIAAQTNPVFDRIGDDAKQQNVRWNTTLASRLGREVMWAVAVLGDDARATDALRDDINAALWDRFRARALPADPGARLPDQIPAGQTLTDMITRYEFKRKQPLELDDVNADATQAPYRTILVCAAILHGTARFTLPPPAPASGANVRQSDFWALFKQAAGDPRSMDAMRPWLRGALGRANIDAARVVDAYRALRTQWLTAWTQHISELPAAPARLDMGSDAIDGPQRGLLWASAWMRWNAHTAVNPIAAGQPPADGSAQPPDGRDLAPYVGGVTTALEHATEWFRAQYTNAWLDALRAMAAVPERSQVSWVGAAARAYLFAAAGVRLRMPYADEIAKAFGTDQLPVIIDATREHERALRFETERARAWRTAWSAERRGAQGASAASTEFVEGVVAMNRYIADVTSARAIFAQQSAQLQSLARALTASSDTLRTITRHITPVLATLYGHAEDRGDAGRLARFQRIIARAQVESLTHAFDADDIPALTGTAITRADLDTLGTSAYALLFLAHVRGVITTNASVLGAAERIATAAGAVLDRIASNGGGGGGGGGGRGGRAGGASAFPWAATLANALSGVMVGVDAPAALITEMRNNVNETARAAASIATDQALSVYTRTLAASVRGVATTTRTYVAVVVARVRSAIAALLDRESADTTRRLEAAVNLVAAADAAVVADAARAGEQIRRKLRELTAVTALADTVLRTQWTRALTGASVGGPAAAAAAAAGAAPPLRILPSARAGVYAAAGARGGAGSGALPANAAAAQPDPAVQANVTNLSVALRERATEMVNEVTREVEQYSAAHATEEDAVARALREALASASAYQSNLTRVLAAQQHEQLNRDANREATRALLRWGAHFQHMVEYRLLRDGAAADRANRAFPMRDRPTSWLLRELKEYQNDNLFANFAGYTEGLGAANTDPPRVTIACGAVLFTVLSAADRVLVHMAHMQDWWRRGHINDQNDVRNRNGPALAYIEREANDVERNMPAASNTFIERNARPRGIPRAVNTIDDAVRGAAPAPRDPANPAADPDEGKFLDAIAQYAQLASALVQLGLQLHAHFTWHKALRGTSIPEFPADDWIDNNADPDRVVLRGFMDGVDEMRTTAAYMLARGTRPTAGRADASEEKEYDDDGARLWRLFADLVDQVPEATANGFAVSARSDPEGAVDVQTRRGLYEAGHNSYAVGVRYGDAARLAGATEADTLFRTRLRWLAALQADTYTGVSNDPRRAAALAAHRPAWEPYCAMAPPVAFGAGAVQVRTALAHLKMRDPVPGPMEDGAGWRQELFVARKWWMRILKAHLVTADVREHAGDDVVRIFNEIVYAERISRTLDEVRDEAVARARDHMNALRQQRDEADRFVQWVAEQAVTLMGAMAHSSEMRAAMERAADAVGSGALRGLLVTPDARLFAWRNLADARAWTALVDDPAAAARGGRGGPAAALAAIGGGDGGGVAVAPGGAGPTPRELCERMPTMAELLQALANELDERWTNLYARLRSSWPRVRPEEAEAGVRERSAALEATQARLRVADANLRLAEQRAREGDADAKAFARLEDAVAPLMQQYYRDHPDAGVFDPPTRSETVMRRMLAWIQYMQMAIERGAGEGGGGGGRGGRRRAAGGTLAIARPLFHAFIAAPTGGVLDRFAHWLTLVQGAAAIDNVTRLFNESMLDVSTGGVVLSTHAATAHSMTELRRLVQQMQRLQENLAREAEAKASGTIEILRDTITDIENARRTIDAAAHTEDEAFAANVDQFRENVAADTTAPMAALWYYLRFILSPALYAHIVRAGMFLGSERSLMQGVVERARGTMVVRPRTRAEKDADTPPVREPMNAGAAVFEVLLAHPRLFTVSAELVAVGMRRSELETGGSRIAESDGQADMGRGRRTGTGGHVSTAMLVEQITIIDQRQRILTAAFERECAAVASGSDGPGAGNRLRWT